MNKHGRSFRVLRDAVVGIGMCSVVVGCYAAWRPLAWIAAGVLLVACAVASDWMEPKNDERGK